MAKEMKVTEATGTTEITDVTPETVNEEVITAEEIVPQALDIKLYVERARAINRDTGKPICTKDGSPLYNYFLPAILRGKVQRVDFATADKGGFEPLDNVFYGTKKAELIISTAVTEFNGKKTTRIVYEVHNTDEDGVIWSCEVRPARKSDNDLLRQYLSVLKAKAEKSAV